MHNTENNIKKCNKYNNDQFYDDDNADIKGRQLRFSNQQDRIILLSKRKVKKD